VENLFAQREALEKAEREMLVCIERYNDRINKGLTLEARECANMVYKIKKIMVVKGCRDLTDTDSFLKEGEYISQFVNGMFGTSYGASDLISIMDFIMLQAEPALAQIYACVHELGLIYRTTKNGLWHISSEKDLPYVMSSKNKRNGFSNELVDAVFATSGYEDALMYAGRAVSGNMLGLRKYKVCIYPMNPFRISPFTSDPQWIRLAQEVYAHQMSADQFEAVIDFRQTSSGYEIVFDHEWIARVVSLSSNCEPIAKIPRDFFSSFSFYTADDSKELDELFFSLCSMSNEQQAICALLRAERDGILLSVNINNQ